ncbi:MAG: diacylglycerol kinase family protein [Bacteroidota bacterium]
MSGVWAYWRKRWRAFGYAFTGAWDLLSNQAPSKIHLVALVGMLLIAWGLDFPLWKWVAVIICAGMVLAAEALNTAVEYVVDLVSPEYHELAGKAKDVAAAGVLFTAAASAIVALLLIGDSLL